MEHHFIGLDLGDLCDQGPPCLNIGFGGAGIGKPFLDEAPLNNVGTLAGHQAVNEPRAADQPHLSHRQREGRAFFPAVQGALREQLFEAVRGRKLSCQLRHIEHRPLKDRNLLRVRRQRVAFFRQLGQLRYLVCILHLPEQAGYLL